MASATTEKTLQIDYNTGAVYHAPTNQTFMGGWWAHGWAYGQMNEKQLIIQYHTYSYPMLCPYCASSDVSTGQYLTSDVDHMVTNTKALHYCGSCDTWWIAGEWTKNPDTNEITPIFPSEEQ